MPDLILSPDAIRTAVGVVRCVLNRSQRPPRCLPSWSGLALIAKPEGFTAALASRGMVAIFTAPLAQPRQQTWYADPAAFIAWAVGAGLDRSPRSRPVWGPNPCPPATVEGVYANGFLRLTNHPAHDLPLEIGDAPDLRGVVVPALLSQQQSPAWPWFLTPTASIDGWGTIPAGPLAGCWAGVSSSIVILAEPESSRPPKAGFNALKRNWLRQLPVNLRPDEVRRLHALSKQRRWPIARIATEAVREALDQDREGRWR